MTPEEKARVKIDQQLMDAGWDIVARNEYVPQDSVAVKEALMQGNTESDYHLFVDNKAIAVVEAKKEANTLGDEVVAQAEAYSVNPQSWYGLWFERQIPLIYLANGNKIYFKNMLTNPDGDYVVVSADMDKEFHHIQWAGKAYILSRIEDEFSEQLSKNGEIYDKEALYWMGYIYRYWNFYTGESSREIYKQAPERP